MIWNGMKAVGRFIADNIEFMIDMLMMLDISSDGDDSDGD